MKKIIDAIKVFWGDPRRNSIPVILWRFVWFIPLIISGIIFCIIVGIMYGKNQMIQSWYDIGL